MRIRHSIALLWALCSSAAFPVRGQTPTTISVAAVEIVRQIAARLTSRTMGKISVTVEEFSDETGKPVAQGLPTSQEVLSALGRYPALLEPIGTDPIMLDPTLAELRQLDGAYAPQVLVRPGLYRGASSVIVGTITGGTSARAQLVEVATDQVLATAQNRFSLLLQRSTVTSVAAHPRSRKWIIVAVVGAAAAGGIVAWRAGSKPAVYKTPVPVISAPP